MKDKDRMKNLEKIAEKYGVDIDTIYPVSPDECDEEFEEVEK